MIIKWLYDHYILRSAIALYYMILVGHGTFQMFSDISLITPAAGGAYLTLMGLPAAAVSLIKWRLGKDNNGVSEE